MSRQDQVGTVHTAVFTEDGMTKVVYHQTPVVQFNNEKVILNTGGWYTNTTKTRMNQASNQYGLGFHVYQEDFGWFVVRTDPKCDYGNYDWRNPIAFEEGMILER